VSVAQVAYITGQPGVKGVKDDFPMGIATDEIIVPVVAIRSVEATANCPAGQRKTGVDVTGVAICENTAKICVESDEIMTGINYDGSARCEKRGNTTKSCKDLVVGDDGSPADAVKVAVGMDEYGRPICEVREWEIPANLRETPFDAATPECGPTEVVCGLKHDCEKNNKSNIGLGCKHVWSVVCCSH